MLATLKRPDWGRVGFLAAHALKNESKDIQLLAWLFEAQVRGYGLAGVAPALVLIRETCVRYWDGLHPVAVNGDTDARANAIRAIADKYLSAIRLAPLIGENGTRAYCWADWEQARYHEQRRAVRGDGLEAEGATLDDVQTALCEATQDDVMAIWCALSNGLLAVSTLRAALDSLFGSDAPSLNPIATLLEHMRVPFDDELRKRGVTVPDGVTGPASMPVPVLAAPSVDATGSGDDSRAATIATEADSLDKAMTAAVVTPADTTEDTAGVRTLTAAITAAVASPMTLPIAAPIAPPAAADAARASGVTAPSAAAPAPCASAPADASLPTLAEPALSAPIRDRADAYARLAEIAQFLIQAEPHSPAPYLVQTATRWAALSTPELYREVFVRLGGQLNIFDMLGIESPPAR